MYISVDRRYLSREYRTPFLLRTGLRMKFSGYPMFSDTLSDEERKVFEEFVEKGIAVNNAKSRVGEFAFNPEHEIFYSYYRRGFPKPREASIENLFYLRTLVSLSSIAERI